MRNDEKDKPMGQLIKFQFYAIPFHDIQQNIVGNVSCEAYSITTSATPQRGCTNGAKSVIVQILVVPLTEIGRLKPNQRLFWTNWYIPDKI